MNKTLVAMIVLCFGTAAFGNELCSDIGLRSAYKPVTFGDSWMCFVYTSDMSEANGKNISVDPDGLAIYSVAKGRRPQLVYDLPYAGTAGKINDAFVVAFDGDEDKKLFVLHSAEAPGSWDAVGDVYDVSVINIGSSEVVLDRALSRFFDLGADIVDAGGGIKFFYPYKDRRSVEKAINSPIFRSIRTSLPVDGVVTGKTLIYNGALEPATWEPSIKYVAKGVHVTLEDSSAGWCKVSFTENLKRSQMWLLCEAVEFSK